MTADAAKLELDRQEWRKKRQKEADFLQDQRHALQWKLGKLESDLVAFAVKDRDLQVRDKFECTIHFEKGCFTPWPCAMRDLIRIVIVCFPP